MKTAHLDRLFTILMLVLGLYVTVTAYNYGLYRETVPGPGFFPAIAGVLMTVLSAAILFRDLSGRMRLSGEVALPVIGGVAGVTVAVVAFVYITPLIGMATAAALAMIAIGYLTEEPDRKKGLFLPKLAALSIAAVAFCHVLFGMIIRVPMITGPFGF
ncbi:tripartite tricarboxylate transporter TctB family protein [Ensifer sp.]|jgi:vacuolar-type H+-ATPase subunit I/STV1|uniref:tripartite tricarboxylate transporter TctB family protein n=1 Tax=Ensifer sp. TaxID=1872086 RepID=UPI002E0D8143|nr:tripartite tricarboxylate transporter TctB family protein [Ensifer sp.]